MTKSSPRRAVFAALAGLLLSLVLAPAAAAQPAGVARAAGVAQTGCVQKLDFGLAEVTTSGCLTLTSGSNPPSYTTTSAIQLNGLPFPAPVSGTQYTITEPGGSSPGGTVALGTTQINIAGFHSFSLTAVNWKLPAGGIGNQAKVTSLSVPKGVKIKGLEIGGSVEFDLGYGKDGSHYAAFPIQVDLPNIIKSGPENAEGGVSAAASIRVDSAGVHLDGLKLQATNVWIGKLKVESVCFAYTPSGASQALSPCEVPSLGGKPFIECQSNATGDTWSGNAALELPTASKPKLAVFGSVTGGEIAALGGFVDNLGQSLPIVDGVFVKTIGVGLCLNPLKLKGTVGVSVLPASSKSLVDVTGSVIYTDSTGSQPWSLEFDGDVATLGEPLGSGSVIIRPTGDIDFTAEAKITLLKVVSLDGKIVGWIQIPKKTFNLDGTIQGCINSINKCATAEGLISSTGVAGCLNLGSISYPVIVKDSNWNRLHPWRVHHETRTITLKGGFGYRWGGKSVSIFAASCDMGSYQATKAVAHIAANRFGVSIAPGTDAITLRIAGSTAPPSVLVAGPGGTRIVSPPGGKGATSPGKWALSPNPTDRSTDLLLIKPAAGEWTVIGNGITSVTSAPFAAPPEFVGDVLPAAGGTQILRMAWAMASGDSLTLEEHGTQVNRTIATGVVGHACPQPVATQKGAEKTVCANVVFTPAPGPAEEREIVAYVTDRGVPVAHAVVTTFRAGGQPLPPAPPRLRLIRQGQDVIIDWSFDKYAADFTVSWQTTDGRMYGVTPAGSCRGYRIRNVGSSVGVTVETAGLVLPDLASGRFDKATLPPGQARVGAPGGSIFGVCTSSANLA